MPVAVPCLLAAVVRRRIDGRFRDLHAVDLMIAVIRERCDQHHVGACQTEAVADLRIFVGGRADLGRIVGDGPRRLSAAKSPRPGDEGAAVAGIVRRPAVIRRIGGIHTAVRILHRRRETVQIGHPRHIGGVDRLAIRKARIGNAGVICKVTVPAEDIRLRRPLNVRHLIRAAKVVSSSAKTSRKLKIRFFI